MAEFDDQTEHLVQQLYDAWSTKADPTSYLNLRDQLLSRRERADTCIATLKTVINVTCPQINATDRYFDPRWEELFTLAESIESSAEDAASSLGKRKRGYNEVYRLRNLAIVSALWSPGVVRHYSWNSASQGCLQLLKTCALQFPHFGDQFCPHLNRVLLDRHCEAIVAGHLKTLSEAPLQCYRDLNILAAGGTVPDPKTEEMWVTSSNGAVPIDSNGRLLKDVRPYHVQQHLLRRDRFGMLVARGESQGVPDITSQQSDFALAPSEYDQFFAHDDGLLATVSGLTVFPPDTFSSLGLDSLENSFAPSCQAEGLLYGTDPASNIILSGDSTVNAVCNADGAPSEDTSEQCHAESDGTSRPGTGTRKSTRRRTQDDSVANLHKTPQAVPPLPSPASSRGRNGSSRGKNSTIEDELRSRYNEMLSTYTQRICEEAVPGYDQRRARSQWLTSDTKWARIWSLPGSKSLPPGSATSKTDCDVLYCSVDKFLEAARSGEVFQKPVVIKESFSDAGMHHYERFLSLLEDASSSDEQVEVRCIDIKHPMHEGLGKFTAYLRSRPVLSDGLWMSTARSVAKCHRPLFTMLNRFRLLESLSEGLFNRRSNSAPPPVPKVMSLSFNTISFPGAFSGAHLNTPAGSWQRNLSGVQLWVFVPETRMPLDELASLANDENAAPPGGKQRLVVLEENDVLFIPPGLRFVQSWHAPTTCLTEQGMLWDDLSILPVMESITWGRENQATQEDCASQLLPRMMSNLERLIREQPDRFRRSMAQEEFIRRFREAGQSWLVSC